MGTCSQDLNLSAELIYPIENEIEEMRKEFPQKDSDHLIFELLVRKVFPNMKNRYGYSTKIKLELDIEDWDFGRMSTGKWAKISPNRLHEIFSHKKVPVGLHDYVIQRHFEQKYEWYHSV